MNVNFYLKVSFLNGLKKWSMFKSPNKLGNDKVHLFCVDSFLAYGHLGAVWIAKTQHILHQRFSFYFYFLFFINAWIVTHTVHTHCAGDIVHCSWDPHHFIQEKKIKNGSHGTIYTFKNYFVTVFSIFSFQLCPNRP